MDRDRSTEGSRPTRRELLRAGAAGGAWLALGLPLVATGCASAGPSPDADGQAPPHGLGTFTISLAEWSCHRALQAGELDHLDFPKLAREEYGIDAVEYVNTFFKDKARDETYLADLKQRCADHGVSSQLIMVDGEGDLATADAAARRVAVDNHRKWLDAAAALGCHSVRVNLSGGSGPLDEQARRSADSLRWLAELATPHELNVIVENHGGLSSNGAWLAGVMKRADHPRVGTLPDFGNFKIRGDQFYDRYRGVGEMMRWAKAVSAKSYGFDADGNETTIDYARMLAIVLAAGYHGHLGIEYEGDELSEPDGIRRTKALLERVRDQLA